MTFWEFANHHEIVTLILGLSLFWALERTIKTIVRRNQPTTPNDE